MMQGVAFRETKEFVRIIGFQGLGLHEYNHGEANVKCNGNWIDTGVNRDCMYSEGIWATPTPMSTL